MGPVSSSVVMRTSIEPLEGHRVKLSVEVDEEDLVAAEEETFRRLAREVRVPGFRPGKVPKRVLASRLGAKVLRSEVIRDVVPRFYNEAVESESLDVIAEPSIDITGGEEGGALGFEATVEVRPVITLSGYDSLKVTIPNPIATDDEVEAQVDRLREQFAKLTEVDRAVRDGDVVTLDIKGSRNGEEAEGLNIEDLVYEVGKAGIVDGLDEKLVGAVKGDVISFQADDAPDGPADLSVNVKLVREKELPEESDEFASDSSEFDTMAELREDLIDRLGRVKKMQAVNAFREGAVEALASLVDVELPHPLVHEGVDRLLGELRNELVTRRVTLETFLTATEQTQEELYGNLVGESSRQVKVDLALRALALAEGIEVDEADVDEEIVRLAAQIKQSPPTVRELLERDNRMIALRSDIRNAKALAWLFEHVEAIDEEGRPVDRSVLQLDVEGSKDEPLESVGDLSGSSIADTVSDLNAEVS